MTLFILLIVGLKKNCIYSSHSFIKAPDQDKIRLESNHFNFSNFCILWV